MTHLEAKTNRKMKKNREKQISSDAQNTKTSGLKLLIFQHAQKGRTFNENGQNTKTFDFRRMHSRNDALNKHKYEEE